MTALKPETGLQVYLVGGAVRDKLLGIPVTERDWVVVGATEQAMLERGFRRENPAFPVFRHPLTGDEYALARTETKTAPGYKGFEVYAGPEVKLENDLRRRDLTINAIAEGKDGALTDPFNGLEDLERGLLRHITPAFVEDPVRLLRAARFAAKLGRWEFRIARTTHGLMKAMAGSGELSTVTAERIWAETEKALVTDRPHRFFEVLRRCGALPHWLPELDTSMGMGEPEAKRDDHAARPFAALRRACKSTEDPVARFAALMYAAAHRAGGAEHCERLHAPRVYCDALKMVLSVDTIYPTLHCAAAEDLLDFLVRTRALQRRDQFRRVVEACAAIWPDPNDVTSHRLHIALEAAAAVQVGDIGVGHRQGTEIGEALLKARRLAIGEALARPEPMRRD